LCSPKGGRERLVCVERERGAKWGRGEGVKSCGVVFQLKWHPPLALWRLIMESSRGLVNYW
jgi:hypothetical protein